MSSLTLFSKERDKPTTDWDDAQRRIGNLPPLNSKEETVEPEEAAPPPPPPEDLALAEELAAGVEELTRIRAERIEELKAASRRPRFGSLTLLKREDYKAEVNEADEGVGVVVFLHKPRHYLSSYTVVLLEKLARKFGDVKFLQIDSKDCIPNYPDANLPTLLIYRDDDLLRQCVGASAFGGKSFGVDDIEWELAQAGIIETDLPKNPHEPRSK